MNEYEVDVSQRHTIYDDSDEEECNEPLASNDLSFGLPDLEPPKGGTLVFAIGRIPTAFVRTYFELEAAPVFSVTTNEPRRALKGRHFVSGEVSAQVSTVFRSSTASSVLACLNGSELNADHCNTWCEGVLAALRPDQVLVLHSLPLHEHVNPPAFASSLLRGLHTSTWRQTPVVATFLEAPNTIKGEPAAVLTHCEMKKVPAALAVLYGSPDQSGVESVNAFYPLLQHALLGGIAHTMTPSKAAQVIKTLLPKPREDLGHLYM